MDYLANKYTDYYEYVGYKWTKDRISRHKIIFIKVIYKLEKSKRWIRYQNAFLEINKPLSS